MKHFTVDSMAKLLGRMPQPGRRPRPFPGHWPTRIAWDITLKPHLGIRVIKQYHPHEPSLLINIKKVAIWGQPVRYRYCGKPSLYRVREVLSALAQNGAQILDFWAMEFDAGGVLGYEIQGHGLNQVAFAPTAYDRAYSAYHPQGATVFSILGAWSRPVYLKRIGRFPTYSLHQRLSAEKVDAFYNWFEKSFEKRLRRPKQKPMLVEIGGSLEAQENTPPVAQAPNDL
jgi:hypothetical protein